MDIEIIFPCPNINSEARHMQTVVYVFEQNIQTITFSVVLYTINVAISKLN